MIVWPSWKLVGEQIRRGGQFCIRLIADRSIFLALEFSWSVHRLRWRPHHDSVTWRVKKKKKIDTVTKRDEGRDRKRKKGNKKAKHGLDYIEFGSSASTSLTIITSLKLNAFSYFLPSLFNRRQCNETSVAPLIYWTFHCHCLYCMWWMKLNA